MPVVLEEKDRYGKDRMKAMKPTRWQLLFGGGLVVVSLILYLVHYAVFRDLEHVFLWSLTSLAFLPISVLVVTLIINRLLVQRERNAKLQKLNMVIGAFFSEVGTHLLVCFSDLDPDLEALHNVLIVDKGWTKTRFQAARRDLRRHAYTIDVAKADLAAIRAFLGEKRDFLLRLLENPNLLEHEVFTALLRAVFHLTEELGYRNSLEALPDSDREHLAGDIRRAYAILVGQWVDYMRHMKEYYPYLFSLAMRTNPFDETASPIVQD